MNLLRGVSLLLPVASLLAACGGDPGDTSADTVGATPVVPAAPVFPIFPVTPVDPAPPAPELALNAVLTGREVVPAVYDTRATAAATFTLDGTRTRLGYTLEHTVEAPTEVHVHLGIAGEAGEVLLTLPVGPGVLTGTVPVSPDQARAIAEGNAYVDVHSEAHPDGEVRAQIVLPGELVYVAQLTGEQVNPPNAVRSSGLAQVLVDGTTNRMRFHVFTRGMTVSPTDVSIHVAPAGADGPTAVELTDPKTPPSPLLFGARTVQTTQDLDYGRWYVNVGSPRLPTGEIRGQLLRPGEVLFVARLGGDGASRQVNTTGYGSLGVILGVDRDRVRYDGLVTDVSPTGVTLQDGGGNVVMQLRHQGRVFDGLSMFEPNSRLLSLLLTDSAHVSVASEGFPAGEVQGLLRRM